MCPSSLSKLSGGLGHSASGAAGATRGRVRSSCSTTASSSGRGHLQLHTSLARATKWQGETDGLVFVSLAKGNWLRTKSAGGERGGSLALGVRCHARNGGSGEPTTSVSVSVREKDKEEEESATKGTTTAREEKGGLVGGLPLAEVSRRRKISEAMKKKWNDPSYKTKMASSQRGKASKAMTEKWKCEAYALKVSKGRSGIEPWNKGRKLSENHKKRIKQAKTGTSHSEGTKEKMSRSQKKRYAAARVLQSMDMLAQQQHKALNNANAPGTTASARAMNNVASASAMAASPQAPLVGTSHSSKKQSAGMDHQRSSLLNRYKSILHDFRLVESEIKPWVTEFNSEHGRKPTTMDVEATKMDWLIQKYKKYNLMKRQLILQIPGIKSVTNPPKSPLDRGMANMEAKNKDAARMSALFNAVTNSKWNNSNGSTSSLVDDDATANLKSSSSSSSKGEEERRRSSAKDLSQRMSKLETLASQTNNPRMKAALRHVGEYRENNKQV